MKRLITICLLFFSILSVKIQAQGLAIAQEYGENLRMWAVTENDNYRTNVEKMCDGKKSTRVADEIAMSLAERNGVMPNISYMLDSYLNWIEKAMQEGLSIEFTDFNVVPIEIITVANSKDAKFAKGLAYVSCNVSVTGAVTYYVKDLICIRDGKITKIAKYEEQKTSSGVKVRVDLSDIENTSMFGFTLNHDQHFPVGASLIGQSGWFMCSLDFGFNLDSKTYIVDKMEITNIMNYDRTKTEYDPKMFLTVTPSVFLKYISVGCGVGFAWLEGKEETSSCKTTLGDDGNVSGLTYGSASSNVVAVKFMLRPQVRGYIPLNRSCNMSIGVGYDIIPKMKNLNGYNVSIGFHFDFDGWDDLFSWW